MVEMMSESILLIVADVFTLFGRQHSKRSPQIANAKWRPELSSPIRDFFWQFCCLSFSQGVRVIWIDSALFLRVCDFRWMASTGNVIRGNCKRYCMSEWRRINCQIWNDFASNWIESCDCLSGVETRNKQLCVIRKYDYQSSSSSNNPGAAS